uniref:GPI transamidase component PIG-S n=1 Tax=Globisporangium ultimum (strain ATCC 200006 / CBS 805.95 / DAOM BR144) TaxID=431595 RepID=K3XB52_GLOUD
MVATRLQIVASFVLFTLAAAPFAWRFTQIERVELPEERIRALNWSQSRFAQPETFAVAIYALVDDTEASGASEERERELSSTVLASSADRIQYASVASVRVSKAQRQGLQTAQNVQQVDDTLARILPPYVQSGAQFSIVLLCHDTKATDKDKDTLVVGKYRHAWSSQCSLSPNTKLFHAVERLTQQHVFPTASVVATKKARTALKYRLQFSLLKEGPELQWQWEFSTRLFPRYLQVFVKKVGVLATFTVETEVVHYARLAKEIQSSDDGKAFYVRANDLKQFKSTNDFLTSSVLDDREQVLHFMAALPVLEHSPLGIQADEDEGHHRLASSFEIPGWGGVAIVNTTRVILDPSEDAHNQETKRVMGVFLSQFRSLIGAPPFYARQRAEGQEPQGQLIFLASPQDGIADWELDVIVRSLIKLHLRAAIMTLQSIVQLVAEMTEMSVLERVQHRIETAVTLLEEILCVSESSTAGRECSAETDLSQLLAKVRKAAEHTDAAYYDHTMIRQLYFPQEQMFGVYAPLLAPLILPFFVGLIREFKRWKAKTAERKKAAEKAL